MPGFTSHASLKMKWLRVKINQVTPSERKPYTKPSFYNKEWLNHLNNYSVIHLCWACFSHTGLYQLRYTQTLMFIFQWHPAKPSSIPPSPRTLPIVSVRVWAQRGQVLVLKIICNPLVPTVVFFICIIKCLWLTKDFSPSSWSFERNTNEQLNVKKEQKNEA